MLLFRNGLISQLSQSDQEILIRNARLIEIKQGDILISPNSAQPTTYFLTSGSVALFVAYQQNKLTDGLAVGLVGRDGAVGLQAALGLGVGNLSLVVQSAGFAYAVEADKLQRLIKRRPHWIIIFTRYLWSMYQEIARMAAFSHTQDIKMRLADWLLMSADRCKPAPLFMTHEHIAHMLGVRRASVTLAAKELKKSGVIQYSRGKIQLLRMADLFAISHPKTVKAGIPPIQ